MASQDDAVQTLVKLGLTVLQAKVYLALAKTGNSTARTTAKTAKTASQDVYRILTELQEKGLVEKIIAKQIMYKATPFNEGLSILLKNKKEEYIETEKQAKMLANNFCENKNQNIPHEKLHFAITYEPTLLFRTFEKLADTSKNSIDTSIPTKMNDKMIFHNWPYLKRAIRRGAKIRIITQKTEGEATSRKPKLLSKNPLFEHRYLPETIFQFGMHIFDKRVVMFALSEKPIPGIQTNNLNAIKIAEAYFEKLWNNAQTN